MRTVVVGNGMAAVRLVEGLVARGIGDITVIGDERHPPYNRILLSAVLEGTHRAEAITLRPEQWYADHGVDLRLGTRVVDIHRAQREVEIADRSRVAYDRLVLATGSIPTLPPIRGLVRVEGRLHEQVHAFRQLDDCLRLVAAVEDGAPRAVVVGGGLLGLQVARALAVRGVETEIVEGGDHLLRSQVDGAAGGVLRRSLERLGTRVYTGARAVRLTDEGLRLDNGVTLDTDLVVLTAGGRPSISLARRAALATRRGILVDGTLATSDPVVFAIGDCAEHGRTTGFVGPAWEQARVLADRLAGGSSAYTGHRTVARLRATDLEVAVLGDPEAGGAEDADVVQASNPMTGTHKKLVVRDGAIVAATLVGDLSQIGVITQYFDRRTVLGPREPAALVTPPRTGPAPETAASALPDEAEVCACAGVSAGRIRACSSIDEVRETTRATTGCGGCAPTVAALLGPVPSSVGS
ncbi:assimilatory nitrate reductase electron transfer subunit [Nocardioides terrae]|uniref:Assimilatory nitrate reductase electron transfer subunit n=1 Tax=Nocardioides terrae TaxID=574651 RepID=A0A1I1GZ01_9ACTN|nr:FAD-dependent oxidoreductase [Nocardioides terrae]SFC17079.1 assimilatory nitrate reductase electron transfer subunit [Nocardioides terrae]